MVLAIPLGFSIFNGLFKSVRLRVGYRELYVPCGFVFTEAGSFEPAVFSRRVSFGTFVSHSSPSFASSTTKHTVEGLCLVPPFFCSFYGTCGTV